jgi:DNA-directed RNA polymerase specialized sigma subunit
LSQVCKGCPSWNNGKGSPKCVTSCSEYSTIIARSKPCVDYIQIPSEIVENLSIELEVDYYNILDPKDAVILFLRFHLRLPLREIAKYQQISHQAVDKKIKRILNILSTYKATKVN